MAEVLTADSGWLVQPERFCRYVLRAAYTSSTFHMSLELSPGYRSSTIFWNGDGGCFEISSLLRKLRALQIKEVKTVLVFTAAYGAAVRRCCEVATLCRGDSWQHNIKMKLTKHDVSVLAGQLGVRAGLLPKLHWTFRFHKDYYFVCLFVRYFLI